MAVSEWVEVDFSTAQLYYGTPASSGGRIGWDMDWAYFSIPAFTIADPALYVDIQIDFEVNYPNGNFWLYSLNAANDPDTSNWDTLVAQSSVAASGTFTYTFGPGIQSFNSAVTNGELNILWELDAGNFLTGARYRTKTSQFAGGSAASQTGLTTIVWGERVRLGSAPGSGECDDSGIGGWAVNMDDGILSVGLQLNGPHQHWLAVRYEADGTLTKGEVQAYWQDSVSHWVGPYDNHDFLPADPLLTPDANYYYRSGAGDDLAGIKRLAGSNDVVAMPYYNDNLEIGGLPTAAAFYTVDKALLTVERTDVPMLPANNWYGEPRFDSWGDSGWVSFEQAGSVLVRAGDRTGQISSMPDPDGLQVGLPVVSGDHLVIFPESLSSGSARYDVRAHVYPFVNGVIGTRTGTIAVPMRGYLHADFPTIHATALSDGRVAIVGEAADAPVGVGSRYYSSLVLSYVDPVAMSASDATVIVAGDTAATSGSRGGIWTSAFCNARWVCEIPDEPRLIVSWFDLTTAMPRMALVPMDGSSEPEVLDILGMPTIEVGLSQIARYQRIQPVPLGGGRFVTMVIGPNNPYLDEGPYGAYLLPGAYAATEPVIESDYLGARRRFW